MPNTKSAAKAMRQSERRHARNVVKKDAAKAAVKNLRKLVTENKKSETAEALRLAMKALDKAVKTRVIHKNTAARKKSRLAKAIAKLK
jgi:small subunit ribosomal protein S20